MSTVHTHICNEGSPHVLDIPVAQQAEIETFAALCSKAFGGVASHGRHNASCEAQLSPVWKLMEAGRTLALWSEIVTFS